MGRFNRFEKKANKLTAKADAKRSKVEEIRSFVELVRQDAKELRDDESAQTEAKNYELAYTAGKKAEKQNKRANKAEKRAAEIEKEAGKLEERAAAKYLKGMHDRGAGRVVGAVALAGATAVAASLLAVEAANYVMNTPALESGLKRIDWGTWLDTRNFIGDERVKEIYDIVDQYFAGPTCDGAEKVGEALAPVGDAIGKALTPTIEVEIVTADSMEQ